MCLYACSWVYFEPPNRTVYFQYHIFDFQSMDYFDDGSFLISCKRYTAEQNYHDTKF